MFLGIGTYTFPWKVQSYTASGRHMACATALLQYAAEQQIGFVQFCDNLPLHGFSQQEKGELLALAEHHRIGVQCGTSGLTLQNIERYITEAAFFHSPFIRMVIDDGTYRPGAEAVINILQAALPLLQATKVTLALENHDRFPASILRKIVRDMNSPWVGICLDTANSLGAGEGLEHVVAELGQYTVNLHIKDVVINRLPHKMGFMVEGTPAGTGMLDIAGVIAQVDQTGRCGTATLEVWSGDTGTIESSISRENQWAHTSIQYLKTILS